MASTATMAIAILIGILTGFSPDHATDDKLRQEIYTLAQNVYYESRGESRQGQHAVAWVTINRTRDGRWPTTITEVVWQAKQFSWTRHKSRRQIALRNEIDTQAWRDAVTVAYEAYFGHVEDPTGGATHFFAQNIVSPAWARSYSHRTRIGNHTFLRK